MSYFICFSHLNTFDSTKEVIMPLRILWVYGDFTGRHCEVPVQKNKPIKIIEQNYLTVP